MVLRMRLPGVFGFITKKKPEPQSRFYIAVQIGKDQSKASLWELNDTVTIHSVIQGDDPHELIVRCRGDRTDVHEVIFGLPDEYIHDNSIKEDHLLQLQQITRHTGLTPAGFVVVHEAIAYLLKEETQTPQTALFIGFDPEHISFALYRVGVCKLHTIVKRTDSLFNDFENGIQAFASEEILPSKILLYNEGKPLDTIREQLLSYPWQQNDQFLHVPKIEALPGEYSIQAIVHAGAHELSRHGIQPSEHIVPPAPNASVPDEHVTQAPEPVANEDELLDGTDEHLDTTGTASTRDISDHAETMGFTEGVDILHDHPRETIHADEQEQPKRQTSFPLLRAPHSIMVPGAKSIAVAGVFLLLLAGIAGGIVFWYPKATIALIAEPKIREEEVELTLNTTISSIDIAGKQIPGTVHTAKVSGAKTGESTGKKTIGDKATGTIIVYNKTPAQKTLKKGSVLAATSSVTFTLDNDVQIASASDTGESLEYGKGVASVTASKVGPSGNIKKDTELKITDYDSNALIAKNDEGFSGGTERQITVVSEQDQNNLVKSLSVELTEQAQTELQSKVLGSRIFLPESLQEHIIEKKFDKKSGDEANIVSLEMDLEYAQTSYDKERIDEFLREYMKDKIDQGFTLDTDKSYFTVLETKTDEDSTTFTARYTAYLLPEIDTASLNKELAGKSIHDLEKKVNELSGNNIIGYEIEHEQRIPFLSFLPMRQKNITIKIVPY